MSHDVDYFFWGGGNKIPARENYCDSKYSITAHYKFSRWRFRFRRSEIASARLFAIRRFFRIAFRVRFGKSSESLENGDIQRFSFFYAEQTTKKEPRTKAPLCG